MSDDHAFLDWINRAKDAPIKDVAEMLGARLKRAGHEFAGPCPAGCAKTDGFAINPKKGVFLCRPGGASGSAIDMAMHVHNCDFMQACEIINGEPPPRGESRPIDPEVQREREKAQAERERLRIEDERQERARKRSSAEQWWESSVPIEGTHAQAYLRARGLDPTPSETINIGFIAQAPLYTGDVDEDGRPVAVGRFPCMVAAMRNLAGDVTACHRTYLDPDQPKKLDVPGANKSKKVLGEAGGALIWLSEPCHTVAIAEGIETALSWRAMWTGGEVGIAAAYSLGNMAGAATGTKPHPDMKRKSTIPNGVPDMARPGLRLPLTVREVILLGDGDSDPATTRAHLLTAGRRFRAEGLQALVSMAPDGKDFNDALRDGLRDTEMAA